MRSISGRVRTCCAGHISLLTLQVLLFAACGGGDKSPLRMMDGGPAVAEDAATATALSLAPGWTTYGYDLNNTQSSPQPSRITKESIATLGEKWRVLVGGGATSTPMSMDGIVYFGAWDGSFFAVSSATGEVRWKARVGSQYVRSSALLTADRVYVASDNALVALARADGTILYKTVVSEHPQSLIDSSPKLADGVIVLGVASYELNLKKDSYSFDGSIVGIEASTGAVLYRVPVTGDAAGPCMGGSGVSVWSSAAIDPALGLAFIGTGQTYEQPASTCNDSLLAIHYKADHVGERFAWKATFTADDVFISAGGGLGGLDHDVGAAPNLFRAGEVQAVGVGDKGGTYRAFDRTNGTPLWRTDLKRGMLAQLGGVMTTAAVHEDSIYVASNSWTAFGFVSTGMHAEGDTATLYALDVRTGTPRWMQPLDAPVFGTFAVASNMLFHPTLRGVVHARDLQTGQELWRGETGSAIGSGIGIDDDSLYVSTGLAISVRTPQAPAQVVAYTLAPAAKVVVDLRDETFKQLTIEQCQAALSTLQPDPTCRSCLCECNPSTTGACQGGCWQQAPCLVKNCAASDFGAASGQACYAENCASKLLPPSVYQESVRSAMCAVKCAPSCGF